MDPSFTIHTRPDHNPELLSRTVTAYGMQESPMDKFDSSLEIPRKAGIKQGLLSGLTIGATSGERQWG